MLAEAAASLDSEIERKAMDDPQAAEASYLQTLACICSIATAAGTTAC